MEASINKCFVLEGGGKAGKKVEVFLNDKKMKVFMNEANEETMPYLGALKWGWIFASGNSVLLFCAPPCNCVYMGTIVIHPFLLRKSNLIENITSSSNTEITSFTYNNICTEYIIILSYSGTSICQCFVCAEQCTESQNYSLESQINYFTFFF